MLCSNKAQVEDEVDRRKGVLQPRQAQQQIEAGKNINST